MRERRPVSRLRVPRILVKEFSSTQAEMAILSATIDGVGAWGGVRDLDVPWQVNLI